jgi:hypothetical protein
VGRVVPCQNEYSDPVVRIVGSDGTDLRFLGGMAGRPVRRSRVRGGSWIRGCGGGRGGRGRDRPGRRREGPVTGRRPSRLACTRAWQARGMRCRAGTLGPATVGSGPSRQAAPRDTGEPDQQHQRDQEEYHTAGPADDRQQSAATAGGVHEHRRVSSSGGLRPHPARIPGLARRHVTHPSAAHRTPPSASAGSSI